MIIWFFCKANRKAARTIKVTLEDYCDVLGQLSSFYKSVLQFSKGIENRKKWYYWYILITFIEKHRNLPRCQNIDHRRIRIDFTKLKKIISTKLAGQKARVLSHKHKMIVIASNLQVSIFIRCMVPNIISKKIDGVNRNFFWGNNLEHDLHYSSSPLI